MASLEALESQALESQRRTGGSSARGMAKVAQPPVRPRAKNSRCPNSRDEFHTFVADNNLHDGLAEEWYAMHEDREWVDRDGKTIKDDCPAKVKLAMMVNKWMNPWNAMQDLEKVIPAKRLAKLKENLKG